MLQLKENIRKRGLKQSWVAEQIGINANTLRSYLNGERNMPQHISDKVKQLIGK